MPAHSIRPDRTSTKTASASDTKPALDAPTFELSIRQLLASAGAAVTAGVLGSRLSIAGTLIGAALASAITMVASAVYSHTIAAAEYRVRVGRPGQLGSPVTETAVTVGMPVAQQAWGMAPPPVVHPGPVAVPAAPLLQAQRRRPRWATAGLGALAACALALLVVTGIEAVRGAPLSGGDTGGLSVLGGRSAGTPDGTSDPAVPATEPADGSPASSSAEPSTSSTSDEVTSTVTVTATDPASSSTGSAGNSSSAATRFGSATPTSSTLAATTTATGSTVSEPTAP